MIVISFIFGLIIGIVCSKGIITFTVHPERINSSYDIEKIINEIENIINEKKNIFNKINFSSVNSFPINITEWKNRKNNGKVGNGNEFSKNRTPTFIHIVKYGETLHSIGRKNGVHHKVIMKINSIKYPNELKVNDQLIIPIIRHF